MRRVLLIAAVTVNLGARVLQVLRLLRRRRSANSLRDIGVTVRLPLLKVILPIGISFFTFQAIAT